MVLSDRSAVEVLVKIMTNDIVIGVVVAAVTGGIGWAGTKLRHHWQLPEKVAQIEGDVLYVRSRVDSLYDHLISPDRK
jgi:hypothetical protein